MSFIVWWEMVRLTPRRTRSYVFYALSFPLHRVHGPIARTYSTFTLTDEAWALTTAPEAQTWSRARILAIQASFQIGWVGSVTAGALGGAFIPDSVAGLQFAVSAFFLVLAMDAFAMTRNLPPPLVAIGCALAARWLFGSNMLVPALAMFLALLLVPYAVARRKEASREL